MVSTLKPTGLLKIYAALKRCEIKSHFYIEVPNSLNHKLLVIKD